MVGVGVVPEIDDQAVSIILRALEIAVYGLSGIIYIEISVAVGLDGESFVFCWKYDSVLVRG